ncbi:MAG TPA: hypothetical protein VGI98_05055 [Candidatus Limnocylindrales bacterium]|jgi:hypothetical protein
MSKHTRNILIIGISPIIISAIYLLGAQPLGYHIEWAGVTMLFALGWAIGIMSYVLTAGGE